MGDTGVVRNFKDRDNVGKDMEDFDKVGLRTWFSCWLGKWGVLGFWGSTGDAGKGIREECFLNRHVACVIGVYECHSTVFEVFPGIGSDDVGEVVHGELRTTGGDETRRRRAPGNVPSSITGP